MVKLPRILLGLSYFFLLLFVAWIALAKPPPGPPGPNSAWYHSLLQPATGISCCSEADWRPVDWRIVGDHYEVFLTPDKFAVMEPHWEKVPNDAVLHRNDNPTGRGVACYAIGLGLMCFIKGGEV